MRTGKTDGQEGRYGYLSALSAEELETLLRASGELGREDEEAYADAIVAALVARERMAPTGRLPDEDKAWRDFETHFDTPEGEGLSLYGEEPPAATGVGTRRPRNLRGLAVAAVLLLCVVTALPPALGYENVFAMVGHWNETVFHFALPGRESDSPEDGNEEKYNSLREMLIENGITEALVPTKVPEGFELVDISVSGASDIHRVDYNALYQNEEGKTLSFYVIQRKELATRAYEKDEKPVEVYTIGEIDHYIYENNGRVWGTWYNGTFECSIQGDVSGVEIKEMIKTIYESE